MCLDATFGCWEAIDETSSGSIGTSVSHSGGTFTIGATGIWLVQCQFAFKMSTTNRYFSAQIQFTPDAWSSTEDVTNTSGSAYRDSGTYYQMGNVNSEIFDVQIQQIIKLDFKVLVNKQMEQKLLALLHQHKVGAVL